MKSFIDKKAYDVEMINFVHKEFFSANNANFDEKEVISSICPSIGSKEYKPLFTYCFYVTIYTLIRDKLGFSNISVKITTPAKKFANKHHSVDLSAKFT